MAEKKTILLVEDEAVPSMAEQRALEKSGYAVIAARSGEEALQAFYRCEDIDLAILDIGLGQGRMDG